MSEHSDDLDLRALVNSQPGSLRSERLLASVPASPRWLRVACMVAALTLSLTALPWLAAADPWSLLGGSTDAHLVRDGALGSVVAVAALIAAWRPRWALPAFGISTAAVLLQLVANLGDGSSASTGANELVHLPLLITVLLVGALGFPRSLPAAPTAGLELVD